MGADLSAGFNTFRQWDDSKDEHIDSLLATIIDLEQRTGQRCPADLITWRGMMTKIMSAPFDRFNSFQMNATLFHGTIFIEEDHAAKVADRQTQQRQPNRGGHSQDLMSFWGYKFETLSLIPNTWDATSRDYIESRETETVSNYAQYCSVVQTGIGSTTLVIGGEVDAGECKYPNIARSQSLLQGSALLV
jgi:RAT1-interacting protein